MSTISTAGTRRYTFLRRIAVGGMGELLLARAVGARGVQKLVAIKRVRSEYASDQTFVSMFVNEARLAATLDHANVVRTYDLVEDGESFFMVMEYLHGESLGRLLNVVAQNGERIPLVHAITVVLGVAAGLHCAHERRGVDGRPLGIVHRDLSPGNVFITYEGGVKLLDFGIAKATSRTSITLGPTRKGKVSYMSPEQCVGAEVDRRSDIFALGVIMWELCTGQRLFRGDNEFAIMNQVATADAPSPRIRVPELPPQLCDIVARALQRDPAQRFQTAMELHTAVESFAAAQGLLPSNPAVGRYLEEMCGRREYPSAEPSEEFSRANVAPLVVTSSVPTPRSRGLTLVLALAAGAVAGALGVAAASSATTVDAAIAAPPAVAAPIATPPPSEPQTPAPAVAQTHMPAEAPASAPAERAEEPAPSRVESAPSPATERKRVRRSAPTKRRAAKPTPAASDPPASDKTIRGVDGLLPSD
jgi:serine/threonine-protein kinase